MTTLAGAQSVGARNTDATAEAAQSSRVRTMAERAAGLRIAVSLAERRLRVLNGRDTLLTTPVATGTGTRLRFGRREWVFDTPRGVRTVLRKKKNPVWTPPDWAYVEVAREYGLRIDRLRVDRPRRLADGRRLAVRDSLVVVIEPDGAVAALDPEEHVVFDETLFIPPIGTENRRIEGELGPYALDTGDGYLLHGTPHQETIGQAASHGCVRVDDDGIAWLYENVPVGTKVYLY